MQLAAEAGHVKVGAFRGWVLSFPTAHSLSCSTWQQAGCSLCHCCDYCASPCSVQPLAWLLHSLLLCHLLLRCAEAGLACCQVVAMVLDGARNSASKGLTAVHLAVQQGCDSLVNDLLRLPGLAPDARDADGLTALHWAASKGAHAEAACVQQQLLCAVVARAASANHGGCDCTMQPLSTAWEVEIMCLPFPDHCALLSTAHPMLRACRL